MWLQFDTLENFNTFEKQYCLNAMKWTAANRYGADNTLLNVSTQQKVNKDTLNTGNFTTTLYPLFGRKAGVLNKADGYTTAAHEIKLGADNKYYCIKMADVVIPAVVIDGVEVSPEVTVPRGTTFYTDCTWDGTSENEPEWPA